MRPTGTFKRVFDLVDGFNFFCFIVCLFVCFSQLFSRISGGNVGSTSPDFKNTAYTR